jgi:high-affinity iron transporter
MLLTSVVIVLREVLEAALMVSILLAMSRRLGLGLRWLAAAGVVGIGGAIAYASNLETVSGLFDGVGQELVNASLQSGVFLALLLTVFLVAWRRTRTPVRSRLLPAMMAIAVALGVTQEGSEILVFVVGFIQVSDFFSSVAVGAVAGACIGFSIGILFYYLLLALGEVRAFWVSLCLLGLVAASMSMQVMKSLIQADVLPAQGAVWDTSNLIAETSLLGQLLYALAGYEASPAAAEVLAYGGSLALVVIAVLLGNGLRAREEKARA